VGCVIKDKFTGKFVDEWNNFLKESNTELDTRDVSAVMAGILARKEEEEVVGVIQHNARVTASLILETTDETKISSGDVAALDAVLLGSNERYHRVGQKGHSREAG